MLALRFAAWWTVILGLAILNGLLREAWLVPALGRSLALAASGLLLCLCIVAVSWVAVCRTGLHRPGALLTVGAFWLALTLAFEFGFGRLVQHKPWSELWAAYTFEDGNLWPVVLAVTVAGPWLAGWMLRVTGVGCRAGRAGERR